MHVKDVEAHKDICTHEPVECDKCLTVTVPRHQLNHHYNESCWAKETCSLCGCEHPKCDKHSSDQCIVYLAKQITELKKEKVDRDTFTDYLSRKVDRKYFDQTLLMIVNDFQAAKISLNESSAAGPIDDSQTIQSN